MTEQLLIIEAADGSIDMRYDDVARAGIDLGVRHAVLPRMMNWRREAWDWDAGVPVLRPAAVEAEQLARIDRERSARIATVLGPTPEIREMHRRKAAEAAALVDGGSASPLLDAEAAACGMTLLDLTSAVLAQHMAETDAVAAIEAAARAAKDAVRAAETGEVKIAAANAAWEAIDGGT